jgi:DNA-binding transcriptional regulator YhcF (GntR family)
MSKQKGFGKYPRYVADDPTLTHIEKAMVGILACYTNEQLGYTWISVKELSLRLRCSDATTQRCLKSLKEKGVISRDGYHVTKQGASRITRIII